MFGIILTAITKSLFVGAASYSLYSWSHKGGHSDKQGNVKRRPKKNEKTGEKQDRKTGHYAIDKWLKFGGGYYGTVAILKFILSEIGQTFEFVTDIDGMITYFANFGIGTIVEFFVNQLQTFIQAIIWPVDYIDRYEGIELLILFGFTYGAYRWAQKFATAKHQNL